MDPSKDTRLPLITGGIVLALVAAGIIAYLFLTPSPPAAEEGVPTIDTGPDIGAQVSGAVESPAEQLPATNPFSGYRNPFE